MIEQNEWYGTSFQVKAQKKLEKEHKWISHQAGLLSQGRTLLFFDAVNYPLVRVELMVSKFYRVLVSGKKKLLGKLTKQLQEDNFSVNEGIHIYFGEASHIKEKTTILREERNFPQGWHLETIDISTASSIIRKIQQLYSASGISPLPGSFIKGEFNRCKTFVLFDEAKNIMGCSTVQDLSGVKNPYSNRWNESIMIVGLCLDKNARGMGLSSLLNAECLLYGINHYNAHYVYELIESGNTPSFRMSERCGLTLDETEGFAFVADVKNIFNA